MKLQWLESIGSESANDSSISVRDLEKVGVFYEKVEIDGSFQDNLDLLTKQRGYAEQDVVELSSETPDLEKLCAKFAPEHLHTDDEVRLVLEGEGIFDIRSADDRWMRVTVERGDLIVVPANCYHRFFLTDRKQIRCVRLFKDSGGWVPHYREASTSSSNAI